ncbi:MAG TPA: DUF2141 domain-containing protein [Myxococcota bacterium]|nr:DUF2141 domain-containing protein [Myxococcota bacterium]HND30768.1 DUF2141 domain-containing protein [Myxococcota bacterium]
MISLLLAAAQAAEVHLELVGVRADGKPIEVALFSSEQEGFPKMDRAVRRLQVVASAATLVLPLGELGAGDWAVAVHHDQNANGSLDFSWFPPGPSEGTSASCGSRPFAMPSWSACHFQVAAESLKQRLEMWY